MRKPPEDHRRTPLAAVLVVLALAPAVVAQAPGQEERTPPPGQTGSTPGQEEAGQEEAGQEEAAQEEAPSPDRTTFEVQFTDDAGGGSATGSAGSVTFNGENRVLLRGGIEVLYQDLRFRADEAELDQEEKIVTARGNVLVEQGPRRLMGESLVWDLDLKTGRVLQARGQVSTDYFFAGDEIAKTGEMTYTVQGGQFTSCDQEVPDWSFTVGRAKITIDGYAKSKNATLRFKNVPVLRMPYLLWPVREERTSGFLLPKPGFSSRRGASLSLAYYQVMGPSYDTTFQLDLFSRDNYLGFGNEFRYHPTEGTLGHFEGYVIRDPVEDLRWRVRFDHESNDLPLGFRGVIALEDVSDFNFFRDFERRSDRNSQRQLYSRGFLTGNWGAHSLNFLVDNRETFVGVDSVITLRQLPEIEYKLRSTRLGRSPIYVQMRSAINFFDVERSATLDGAYGRADLFPQFTIPVRAWPWLSLSVTAGGRLTWYQDSLFAGEERTTAGSDSDFRDESLTRTVPTASAEIVGPSFSRIFDSQGKRFSKLKHVVEPRWTYNFFEDFEDRQRIPLFDEVDNLRGRNVGRFSLVNRFLAKPRDPEKGGAREILSLALFQDFSFDEEKPLQRGPGGEERTEGPVAALLRFNPSTRTTLRTEVRYSTLFSHLESTAFSGSLALGRHQVGLRWLTRIRPDQGTTQSNQIRLSTGLVLIAQKLRFDTLVNYDVNRRVRQLQRYLLSFNACCYGLRFEYGEFQGGVERDREFRFSMTLKNVGTFFEITGGQSESL